MRYYRTGTYVRYRSIEYFSIRLTSCTLYSKVPYYQVIAADPHQKIERYRIGQFFRNTVRYRKYGSYFINQNALDNWGSIALYEMLDFISDVLNWCD